MTRPILRFGAIALASSVSLGQMQQASPAWRPGPKTDAADVFTSAGANGTLTFAGKPSPARLYVTCSGAIPAMGKMVVLKIVYRQPPGMPAISNTMKDMEHMEGVAKDSAWAKPQLMGLQGVRAMGTATTLTLQTIPEPIDDMLESSGTPPETFVETYTTPAGPAEFRFPVPPSDAMLSGVLNACGFKPRKGDITPEFSQAVLPVLHDFMALRLHGPISAADEATLNKLQDDAKNQTELGVVTTLSSTVEGFIATEKKASDLVLRKRCLQGLTDQVQGHKVAKADSCEALLPDMN